MIGMAGISIKISSESSIKLAIGSIKMEENKLAKTANLFHCILDPVKESFFNGFYFVTAYFSKFLEQFLLF